MRDVTPASRIGSKIMKGLAKENRELTPNPTL